MTRRIVQLAGAHAEFALADDGTIWLWTSYGWKSAGRGPLPPVATDMTNVAHEMATVVRATTFAAQDNPTPPRKEARHEPSKDTPPEGPRRAVPRPDPGPRRGTPGQ